MERRGLELQGVRGVGEAESTNSESESEDSCSGVEYRNAVKVSNLGAEVIEEMLGETFKQLGALETAWMQQECDLQGLISGVAVYESDEAALEA